jgi:GxxExxY protein
MDDASTGRDPRTFAIIGAAMEVHRVLGPGFLERVYAFALAIELRAREVPFLSQVPFPVVYKQQILPGDYRADFVCYQSIVVELKAQSAKTGGIDHAQMINYLSASGMQLGLLLNFGTPRLDYRRFILSNPRVISSDPDTDPSPTV